MNPHEDLYDTVTLAREHLQNAAALFTAINELEKKGDYRAEISYLARVGSEDARLAVHHFNETAQTLAAGIVSEVQS